MSDQMQDQGTESDDNLKQLRDAADRGSKAERENAFLKAGVDTDSTLGGMFASTYKGDMSKEAIKAAYDGLLAEVAPKPAGSETTLTPEQEAAQAAEEEQQRQQDSERRGIGSTPADPNATTTGDPVDQAFEQFHEERRNGSTLDKAAKRVTGAIMEDAMNGGSRNWNGWTPEELDPT